MAPVNLERMSKALAAVLAALPFGTGTAAVAGGNPAGYGVAVLAAILTGAVVYLAPANEPAGS